MNRRRFSLSNAMQDRFKAEQESRYSLAEAFDELNRLHEEADNAQEQTDALKNADDLTEKVLNWNQYGGKDNAIQKYLKAAGAPKANGPDHAAIGLNMCLTRIVDMPAGSNKTHDMLLKAIKDASAAVGRHELTIELLDALKKALDCWLTEQNINRDRLTYIEQSYLDDCERYMRSFRACIELAQKVDDECKEIFTAIFEQHTFLDPSSHVMKKLKTK